MSGLWRRSIVGTLVVFGLAATAHGAGPLKEKGLVAMVEAGFDEAEIIAKIEKDGIDFAIDDATQSRLTDAGVSAAVLEALRSAATKPAAPAPPTVTLQSVIALLENGVEPERIAARVKKAAATFVLGTADLERLRAAGATAELLAVMQSEAREADAAEPISDLAIVLDVSGSMKEATSDGRPKVEVAKQVVASLIERIPAGLNVAVIIYGHSQGCSAVKVLRPLRELKDNDKSSLVAAIESLSPVGNTPIALALRYAGEQFAGRQTHCGIVLITDGLESCNGNPAAEAARLATNPLLRFGVNVVGFGLQPAESQATAEIASSGKGKYYDAQNGEELLSAIDEVTQRIGQGVEPAPFNPAAPKGRRAVVIDAPQVALPSVKKLVLARVGGSDSTVDSYELNSVTAYDQELRQASPEPVDVWWIPADGMAVKIVAELENPERETKRLRPEDYLGLVRVTAESDNPEARVVVTRGKHSAETIDSYAVQSLTGYNRDLVVPVGTYNVWVIEPDAEPTLLETGLEVAGGQVTTVER